MTEPKPTPTCYRCNEEFLVARKQHIFTYKCRANARNQPVSNQIGGDRTVKCESCYMNVQGHLFGKHKETHKCRFIASLNPLEKIVFFYPDKFDYDILSKNPLINIELIEVLHDKPWDWKAISRNYDIKRRLKYPEKNWYDPKRPDENTKIDFKVARALKPKVTTVLEPYEMHDGKIISKEDIFYFKPEEVSASPLLRVTWIMDMENYPWNWNIIAKNSFKN